jgi:hypothetical protein
MPSRRHVLALLASTPFAANCGGADLPDPLAGWRSPGAGETDPRRFALAHAILAPNPHNTQAWQVALRGEDEMLLYCDLDRRLPFTDPPNRQITLGCGCFLELYRIAAAQMGRVAEVTPFPEGAPEGLLDERPVALVRFSPVANAAPDPLFEAITARRTNRNAYDVAHAVSDGDLTRVIAPLGALPVAARWANAESAVAPIRDLVWRAFDREMRTAGAQVETYQWLRFGREERARHRDGLYIDVPVPGLLRALGQLDEEDIVNPESSANRQAAADWKRKVDTAPAFLWFTTPDDTPQTRLLAGMAYARMNLAATVAGLAMHPWSQALQEYEEMADLYAESKTLLGPGAGETVQMLVRVGYAGTAEPAARRDTTDFLRA